MNEAQESPQQKLSAVQIFKNWAKLAVLIGIIPWSYYYVTSIAAVVNHALGIGHLQKIKVGFYLIPIILPPLLLFSWLSKDD